MNHNKDYKFNPRIRDIIEKQKNKKNNSILDVSNVEIENILINSFKCKYPKIYNYSDKSKDRFLFHINQIDINDYNTEEILNFYNLLLKIFNKDELINIIKSFITRYYKPGMIYYNIRVYNKNIIYFMSLNKDIEFYKGFIVNKDYIGDMIKIYPDIKYDENGKILDDVNQLIDSFIINIKKEIPSIKISINNDVYVFADDNDIKFEKFNDFDINLIPVYFFNWE